MGNVIFYISLCLLLPVGLLCFFLERRARRLMISFICGVVACLLGYFINTAVSDWLNVSTLYYNTTFAPIAEEILKFIPVTAIALIVKKGKRGSMANAFAVGVGFCVVENFFYLTSNLETANLLWVVLRCIGTGLMHGMSASIIGLGVYFARQEKHMRGVLVAASLFTAMMYHGLYNLLVADYGTQFLGIAQPLLTYAVLLAYNKEGALRELLGRVKESDDTEQTE